MVGALDEAQQLLESGARLLQLRKVRVGLFPRLQEADVRVARLLPLSQLQVGAPELIANQPEIRHFDRRSQLIDCGDVISLLAQETRLNHLAVNISFDIVSECLRICASSTAST